MSITTYYVVLPFGRDEFGDPAPLEAVEAPSAAAARARARAAARKHGGAVAFSRTGDPDTGDFRDAEILERVGLVSEEMLATGW